MPTAGKGSATPVAGVGQSSADKKKKDKKDNKKDNNKKDKNNKNKDKDKKSKDKKEGKVGKGEGQVKGEKGSGTNGSFLDYYSDQDIADAISAAGEDEVPGVLKSDLSGIFGIPYQFLDIVDPRIDGTEIGQKYAEKIVSRLPLLFLTPCKQKFMSEFSSSDKESALNGIIEGSADLLNIEKNGKYYTTEFDYPSYYSYVNKMMNAICYFTGLGDERVGIDGNAKLKDVNWQNATNDSFRGYFNAKSSVVFYMDGLTSVSESFSNSVTDSSLASSINGYSDQANELRFLLGEESMLTKMAESMGEATNEIASGLGKAFSGVTGGMLSDLANTGISNVLSGGKIIFPKLWQNSDHARSYSFDIKLRSPDHDSLSILLTLLAPLVHILGFVMPKGTQDNNPNVYVSPFLVKAYCKGMFNIDMGIITDLSITRGAECQWNDDGLPTQIDVSITIEDLYSNLFMTDSAFNVAVTSNTALMDYLANLSGLNLAETEFARGLKMMLYETSSSIARLPSTLWNRFDNAVVNLMSNTFNKIGI